MRTLGGGGAKKSENVANVITGFFLLRILMRKLGVILGTLGIANLQLHLKFLDPLSKNNLSNKTEQIVFLHHLTTLIGTARTEDRLQTYPGPVV